MKSIILVVTLLVLSGAFTPLTLTQIEQGKNAIKNLEETELGKDLLRAIRIEFSQLRENFDEAVVGSVAVRTEDPDYDKRVIERVVELMYEVKGQADAFYYEDDLELKEASKGKDDRILELKGQIVDVGTKVNIAQDKLEPLGEEVESKVDDVKGKKEELEWLVLAIQASEDKNRIANAQYKENRDEHDALIHALEQTKHVIGQLAAPSFLQTSTMKNTIREHHKKFMPVIVQEHHQLIFQMLMQMVDDLQLGDETEKFAKVIIDIIEEIIQAEEEARNHEFEINVLTNQRYVQQQADFKETNGVLESELYTLNQQLQTVNTRIKQLTDNVQSHQETIELKEKQIDARNVEFSITNNALLTRLHEYKRVIAWLTEVIFLCENSSISGEKITMGNLRELGLIE